MDAQEGDLIIINPDYQKPQLVLPACSKEEAGISERHSQLQSRKCMMDQYQFSGQPAEDDLEADGIPLDLQADVLGDVTVSWPQNFAATDAYIKTEDEQHALQDHLFHPQAQQSSYTAPANSFTTPYPSHIYQPQAGPVDFLSPFQPSETSGETTYSPLDSGSDHFSQLSTFQTPVGLPVPPQSFLQGQFGNMAIPLGHPEAIPALDFNGYILYASGRNVPEELMRIPSGTSVAEPGSIFDEENGRTYHNHHTGSYYYPNDPAEQDRLDLQHKIFKILHDGGLHRAPVQCPKQVLDVACGTGIWAIQYAWDHPEANVIGTDLSLIQPVNAPPNCSFVKEDSEKDQWIPGAFPAPFDFVYLRLVNAAFNDHPAVMKKCFDNMEPGAWIEYNDASFELICTDGRPAKLIPAPADKHM